MVAALRKRLFPVSEVARHRALWHDGIFAWTIQYPPPRTLHHRIRNLERNGNEPIEWTVNMECGSYRHSPYMNRCRVCGYNHETPSGTDQRWAFRYYPLVPSILAIHQWERRRREKEIKAQYEASLH